MYSAAFQFALGLNLAFPDGRKHVKDTRLFISCRAWFHPKSGSGDLLLSTAYRYFQRFWECYVEFKATICPWTVETLQ